MHCVYTNMNSSSWSSHSSVFVSFTANALTEAVIHNPMPQRRNPKRTKFHTKTKRITNHHQPRAGDHQVNVCYIQRACALRIVPVGAG